MSVNQNISTIEVLHNNENYDHLFTIPIRDHNDYFTLEDINLAANNNLINKDINLLFLIREVYFYYLKFIQLRLKVNFILDW